MIMMTIPRVGDGHLGNRGYEEDEMMTITKMVGDWVSSKKYLHGFNGMRKMMRKGAPRQDQKKRPDSSSSSFPFKILDVFFGLNRERLAKR
jgi:hypothetical protein